jgi:hypothetical protein
MIIIIIIIIIIALQPFVGGSSRLHYTYTQDNTNTNKQIQTTIPRVGFKHRPQCNSFRRQFMLYAALPL